MFVPLLQERKKNPNLARLFPMSICIHIPALGCELEAPGKQQIFYFLLTIAVVSVFPLGAVPHVS